MRNISTAVRGHYDNDGYMWAIIIRRFCDSFLAGIKNQNSLFDRIFPFLEGNSPKCMEECSIKILLS
jgi:hypothetical protein